MARRGSIAAKLKSRVLRTVDLDRTRLSPGTMEAFQNDLAVVIAHYFSVEGDVPEVRLEERGDHVLLVAVLRTFRSP